jgi:hypothetical protein
MADFYIKQNDTLPPLVATFLNYDNSGYIIPDGSTIRFIMRRQNNKAIKVSSTNVIVQDAANGVVQYQWVSGDTCDEGLFDFEFEVTLSGGTRITFPNNSYRVCEITPDLLTQ